MLMDKLFRLQILLTMLASYLSVSDQMSSVCISLPMSFFILQFTLNKYN